MDWSPILQVLTDPTGPPLHAGFSHDGEQVVSASRAGTICVWDTDTGAIIYGPFNGSRGRTNFAVISVTFSLDGKHVISCYMDATICIWEVETGEMISDLCSWHRACPRVWRVAWSWDRKRVVLCFEHGGIGVFDIEMNAVVLGPSQRNKGSVLAIACSRDAKCIASASSCGRICAYDLEMDSFFSWPGESREDIASLALSPDGHHIVSASSTAVRMWDTETGACLSEYHYDPKGP